jgi:hypothetical protein
VSDLAVRVVVEDGLPSRPARGHRWCDHRVCVPCATIQNWVEAGGKKAPGQIGGAFLEWALAAFSGYAAVDERYAGPDCVLSAVDTRPYQRVLYEVLDHEATHTDIEAFLGRWKTAFDERGWVLQGITTAGSALSPAPIRIVFGDVPHQLCPFPRIKDLTTGVLKAVANERERLAQSKPQVQRGRPSSQEQAARRRARISQDVQQKISDGFQERCLFVKRHVKPSGRKRLLHMTRGLPHLRKLRASMEHIYALFDRRCRTQTALDKRKKVRQWVQRFTWMGDM